MSSLAGPMTLCPHCGRIWYSKERLLSGVLGCFHDCGERVTTHKSKYRMWCLQYERWVVYRIETIGGFSCAYNRNITDCNSTELEYLGSAMVVFLRREFPSPMMVVNIEQCRTTNLRLCLHVFRVLFVALRSNPTVCAWACNM